MIKAAEKASRSLVRDFGEVEQLQVSVKGPADFVSAADKKAEEILYKELSAARPGYNFLMEEKGEVKGSDPRHRWIIDPLDGTLNFLNGIPNWSISIACEKDNEIIAGVIYDPVKDELFHAEKGRGAFMRNKRLRVSGTQNLAQAVAGHSSPKLSGRNHKHALAQINEIMLKMCALRVSGSVALDLAYIAAGRLDALIGAKLSPWDVAAGYIIIREAGGFITEQDGKPNPVYGGNILATNQSLFQDMKKLIKECSTQDSNS